MNRDTKAVTITHKENFPKEATEWLGYGAELQVLFGGKWCVGKVVGRERGKVMVKYADGVGIHNDLHYSGCRISTCRR